MIDTRSSMAPRASRLTTISSTGDRPEFDCLLDLCGPAQSEMLFLLSKVCEVGADLHPQGGAEMAFCEGNLQGTQPKDRASSVSPRSWTKRA